MNFPSAFAILSVSLLVSRSHAADAVDFTRDIRPVLEKRCFECHGEKKQKGGLRLDRKADIVKGGDSSEAPLVPGKAGAAPLIARIESSDDDEKMPPKGERVSSEEIVKIKAWLAAGATIPDDGSQLQKKHWAYENPQSLPLPQVKTDGWIRNGIDAWVLARLEKEALKPSTEAEKATLLRRVSLDLTGLPPTLAETDAFLADASPQAYERAVDRLLASPRYGERWARPWLDLARYADTQGYEKDNRRTMWPYRDWVIEALNADMPFDQFTIEQIAGDMLPGATVAQKVATGFHRNTMTNTEGGTDDEEFRYEALVDRVNTTFGVWMGTTFNCAQCHNHKYDPLQTREYYQVMAFLNNTADADRSDESPTMKVFRPGEEEKLKQLREAQSAADKALKEFTKTPEFTKAQSEWEIAAAAAPEAKLPDAVKKALAVAPEQRDDKQKTALAEHYRSTIPEAKKLADAAVAARKTAEEFEKNIPITSVMVELEKPRETKRHVRGAYLTTAEVVTPGTPASLHPFPADQPRNRLGFARWLVARDNPLTARVIVNRAWEQFFGKGIVETVEEFGHQGEPPSHPELLDWLAIQFMDGAGAKPWSMKSLHRLIVTSATYRQSSRVTPELREKDPANRLLARGPRARLEAEMIRDQALAVSGLLSAKIGGPSVMPPQPEGLWQMVYSGDKWETSKGEDKYRRGLYTFWRRSTPYPMMVSFDAPSREFCVLRRNRSNTPLQALNTLNDPAFVEASQALARKVAAAPGDNAAKVTFAFRTVLARTPSDAERARLTKLFESEAAAYLNKPADAEKMATSELGKPAGATNFAELAAWTVVSNVLLNLDETITKG